MVFQNYHRHTMYTNVKISDSIVSNEDYAKKAVEYGHGIISTMEHGYQGRYIEGYELAQKYGLKFVFGTEAYWVKDRFEKDRSNCHIYIAARNENGRQAINDILSEANITGFYAQARIDIDLILSLPCDDVIITTACVAFWKYDDIDEIVLRFSEHFKKNFYLEVQYHDTDKQRGINTHILQLSDKYDIQLIMGCDSHYINNIECQERNDYLLSKGLSYTDEEGWYLDYPSGQEAYDRFAKQCVLDHKQITQAMDNTNIFLEVEEYNNPCFTHDIKMPTLYPELSQEEKDKIYTDLIYSEWEKQKNEVPQDRWKEYEKEIKKEVDVVVKTKHSDYFLLDHAIIKKGIEMGGMITSSGRGSAVSFFTNKLLGLTQVDRISSKVKMYPERFMSATRILESKSLADIDLNLGTPSIFIEAQKLIFGEEHSYPMIAYGTLRPKAAWKMYSKSQNIDFILTNEVSEQIEKYEKALKYAEEDEKDSISVTDYIDKEYQEVFLQSEKYLGVIASWSVHPCAHLLYQGDIRKEIGLIKIKDNLCCLMDGKWAEEYKFLKNDLLKVSVVELIDKTYKRIGISKHTANQLLDICQVDPKIWDIFKAGCVLGVNQVEKSATKSRVMKYHPKNIVELCAFVAAIRPAFKSMYKIFENRERFDYGIKPFDDLIQTPEMPNTFILYQEMAMATLNYAGIPMTECYDIIKNIAKKRVEKVLKYKKTFLKGFSKVLMDNENQAPERAKELSDKVWQILEDSSGYGYNASHSYCMAIDSLYSAYLKTYYPLEFYETFLNILEAKGEKDRMNAVKEEAEEYFKIIFAPFRFGQDNRNILADTENKKIVNSLSSIKGFGSIIAENLYELSKFEYDGFMSFLLKAKEISLSKTAIDSLIKIDYFAKFGNIPTLLKINEFFTLLKQGDAKQISKELVSPEYMNIFIENCIMNGKNGTPLKSFVIIEKDRLLSQIEEKICSLSVADYSYRQKMNEQFKILGYTDITTNLKEDVQKLLIVKVQELNGKNGTWAYAINGKSIGTGKISRWTVRANVFNHKPVQEMDIIYVSSFAKEKSEYWYIYQYQKIA